MLSEPPRCRPVPVRALKGADSPRGLHRGHSPGHWSPPGARSTGGGWSLPASWPDPNSLRQVNPDHDERYRGKTRVTLLPVGTWTLLGCLRRGADPDAPVFRSRKGGGTLDKSAVHCVVMA